MPAGATHRKRITFVVPVDLEEKLLTFAAENGLAPREAVAALFESSLEFYPRWGFKKGIVRAITAEIRSILFEKARVKSIEITKEIQEAVSSPTSDDMEPPSSDWTGSSF